MFWVQHMDDDDDDDNSGNDDRNWDTKNISGCPLLICFTNFNNSKLSVKCLVKSLRLARLALPSHIWYREEALH